jgi:Spy/CpxP family protein refolding chaperone
MKRALTALIALVLVAGIGLAQPEPAAAEPQGMRKEVRIEKRIEMPELTAEQQGKMDAARIAAIRETAPLRADLEVKELELGAMWRADKLDANKILGKVREINDLRGRLAVAEANHRIAMAGILTPEQRKAMAPMRGMGRMGRGMKGKGMGRGMMQGGACPGGNCAPGQCEDCQMD